MLIENGAKVEASDQCGFTALHFACQNGHLDVVRVLLGMGIAFE
jgi:ankyrin repeat protein